MQPIRGKALLRYLVPAALAVGGFVWATYTTRKEREDAATRAAIIAWSKELDSLAAQPADNRDANPPRTSHERAEH